MSEYAYFAGGCFWCAAPIFRIQKGVAAVVSGYSGGEEPDPAYADVKAQRTGHRETVRVEYEGGPAVYARLLEVFLANVDPFDAGGQFIDRGRSYTLAVYYTTDAEKAAAEAALARMEAETGRRPAVAVEPFRAFFEAEEEHQNYDLRHPDEFREELEKSGRAGR